MYWGLIGASVMGAVAIGYGIGTAFFGLPDEAQAAAVASSPHGTGPAHPVHPYRVPDPHGHTGKYARSSTRRSVGRSICGSTGRSTCESIGRAGGAPTGRTGAGSRGWEYGDAHERAPGHFNRHANRHCRQHSCANGDEHCHA